VDFVTAAFASWLVEQIADAGRRRLVRLLLGTEQERALNSAADAAIDSTAQHFGHGDLDRVQEMALVIDHVFATRVPAVGPQQTLLEALHVGIAAQFAPLDDAVLTGTSQSSAQLLEVSAAELAEELTECLVHEILIRGARGGVLAPLANQLNHDLTHIADRRVEAKLERLTQVIELRAGSSPERRGLRARTRMHDENGRIRRVNSCTDTDAMALGVHPAIAEEDRSRISSALPVYVRRDVERTDKGDNDESLATAFADGGLAIIEGASASGKTRLAFEAMRRLAPDRWLIVPDSPVSLRGIKNDGVRLRHAVVWLDDIDYYIAAGGLDAAILDAFCPPGRKDVMLLGTLRSEARNQLEEARDLDGKIAPNSLAAKEVFARAQVILLDRYLTPSEMNEANELRTADPRIGAALDQETGAGFAEYIAAAPAILQRWNSARRGQNTTAAAIISLAVDAGLLGIRTALSAALLEELHVYYLHPREVNSPDRPTFAESLRWAVQSVRGASSCLVPDGGNTYRAFDYLVDHEQHAKRKEVLNAISRSNAHEGSTGIYMAAAPVIQIPIDVWRRLMSLLQPSELEMFGLVINLVGLHEIAKAIYWHLSSCGTSVLYVEDGETQDDWLTRTAEAGHSISMHQLAIRRYQAGDLQGAEQWYGRAAAQGHSDSMNNLAVLHYLAGDRRGAEQWFRLASEQGHNDARNNLAIMLSESGEAEEAKQWWQWAADNGDEASLLNLGLPHETGSTATIVSWFRHGPEMWNDQYHGIIYRGRIDISDPDAAESLWLSSAEHGDVAAIVKLATVYNRSGNLAQAKRWFSRAADVGNTDAMRYLGFISIDLGDELEAAEWWRRAASSGDFPSMVNVAGLLQEAGQEEAARRWWRRAASFGYLSALRNLFVSYRDAGNGTEAALWFRRLAEAGNTEAMFDLGTAAFEAGHLKEAEPWLWRAANAKHTRAMMQLSMLLYRTGRNDEAVLWATKTLKDGEIHSETTDVLLIFGNHLSNLGQEAEAVKVWQSALGRMPPEGG
jgi:uncharacterized protein